MQDLPIKMNTSTPGLEDVHSFTARIYNDALELAPAVVAVTQQLNIRSASSLVSYLQVFPEPIANALGWSLDELQVERLSLLKLLKGTLPDQLLVETPTFKAVYGVTGKK
jgi:hypothetical protein